MEKEKYLLVKGCAGIGNRLFTLASAIQYAENTNRIIIVDWRDGVFNEPDKDAFSLFFVLENINTLPIEQIKKFNAQTTYYPQSLKFSLNSCLYDNYAAAGSKYLHKIPGVSKLYSRLSRLSAYWKYSPKNNFGVQLNSDLKAITALFSKNDVEYGHKLSCAIQEDVVLFADYWPGDIERKYFAKINTKETLKTKIQSIKSQLGIDSQTTAVHIRNTDKKPGKEILSLVSHLKLESKRTNSNIFLATDDVKVEQLFRESFSDKLITLPKLYPDPNSNQNMHHWSLKTGDYTNAVKVYEECLIDLYLLASCTKFYYQGNSSFSKIALSLSEASGKKINWLADLN